jgi:hypothetical protein
MDSRAIIARMETEFSTGWCEKHPEIAAEAIGAKIAEIQGYGLPISFDFSRSGFFKIIGGRK